MLKFSKKNKKQKISLKIFFLVKENRESIEIFNFFDMEFAIFSDKNFFKKLIM